MMAVICRKYTGEFLREDESNCSNKHHGVVALLPLDDFVDWQHHLTETFQIFLQSLKLCGDLRHTTASSQHNMHSCLLVIYSNCILLSKRRLDDRMMGQMMRQQITMGQWETLSVA